ncbi:hypothetical protein MSG28_005267 [Choristoneura fumiferana]|uniref:Uncharacterized protein n=1 Tax=Choristoneura fumiferana TaxID=7141 RepID=A0ACC0JQK3_CHOFU|nr:hypothetical protein MSG28_005267 [Choristoneura fumiferana]
MLTRVADWRVVTDDAGLSDHRRLAYTVETEVARDGGKNWQLFAETLTLRLAEAGLTAEALEDVEEVEHLEDIVTTFTVIIRQACDASIPRSVNDSRVPKLDVDAAVAASGAGSVRVHIERIQLNQVEKALDRLKPKRSAEPDGIPAYVVRDCRSVLAKIRVPLGACSSPAGSISTSSLIGLWSESPAPSVTTLQFLTLVHSDPEQTVISTMLVHSLRPRIVKKVGTLPVLTTSSSFCAQKSKTWAPVESSASHPHHGLAALKSPAIKISPVPTPSIAPCRGKARQREAGSTPRSKLDARLLLRSPPAPLYCLLESSLARRSGRAAPWATNAAAAATTPNDLWVSHAECTVQSPMGHHAKLSQILAVVKVPGHKWLPVTLR